jgi:hypothetical protein
MEDADKRDPKRCVSGQGTYGWDTSSQTSPLVH